MKDSPQSPPTPEPHDRRETLMLMVRPELYRAVQRCIWMIIHETGRTQIDIMEEMVRDFLAKHDG